MFCLRGEFKIGGARGKTKKGAPLLKSLYSANREKHIWSSLTRPP